MTIQLVETVTVGSGGASSIQFNSIPQDAQDLFVSMSYRFTSNDQLFNITLNNTTSSRYSYKSIGQIGGSNFSGSGSSQSSLISYAQRALTTSETFSNSSIRIGNYSQGLTTYSILQENVTVDGNAGNTTTLLITHDFLAYGASISSIQMTSPSGNFVEHSTASLYKITAA